MLSGMKFEYRNSTCHFSCYGWTIINNEYFPVNGQYSIVMSMKWKKEDHSHDENTVYFMATAQMQWKKWMDFIEVHVAQLNCGCCCCVRVCVWFQLNSKYCKRCNFWRVFSQLSNIYLLYSIHTHITFTEREMYQ